MKLPEISWIATKSVATIVLGAMFALVVLRVIGINLIASWGAWWLAVIIAGSVRVAAFLQDSEAGTKAKLEELKKRAKDAVNNDRTH